MCVWSEAVRSDSIKFGKCYSNTLSNTLSLQNVSLSLGEMEHNQSHSRESIKITHNRVKRSRLFLNAFMRTLRRANAISAPRKSATREFCKWRREEHPRETKKNFERDDDEQRERERERGEKQKRKGRRDARCSFSLLLLLTCGIFFREYARWSRAIEDVLCISTVVVVLVLCGMLLSSSSSSFTWHARKKLWWRRTFFYSSFFNFFSVSLLIAISLRGSVARIYESKKNTNNNRLI